MGPGEQQRTTSRGSEPELDTLARLARLAREDRQWERRMRRRRSAIGAGVVTGMAALTAVVAVTVNRQDSDPVTAPDSSVTASVDGSVSALPRAPLVVACLRRHRRDRYLALRRAIIEGCDYLKERVIEDESAIQFRAFIGSGFGKPGREVTREDMGDYLDALQQSLPASAPRNGDEKERLFRLFVRALAHEWETRAEPENPRKISSRGSIECRLLPALGWIMKNVRNWMSHNSVINHLDEADVAFLYLVNMRAMFRWDFAPVRFEKLALILLKSGDGGAATACGAIAKIPCFGTSPSCISLRPVFLCGV